MRRILKAGPKDDIIRKAVGRSAVRYADAQAGLRTQEPERVRMRNASPVKSLTPSRGWNPH